MSGLAPIETFGLAQFVQRIMLARQCGFLSDEEVEDWIVLGGLVEA